MQVQVHSSSGNASGGGGSGRSNTDYFTSEFEINDSPAGARKLLTKGYIQDEISRYSGAAISTRGRYLTKNERNKTPTDRPLYLFIQGPTKNSIQLAIQKIHEIIRNDIGVSFKVGSNVPSTGAATGGGVTTNISGPNHMERLYVGLDGVPPSFDLKGKIIGQGGSNLAFIRSETGASVSLCGGEGLGTEPLHLLLEHSTKEGLHSASLLAANLIETISQEFHQTHYQQMNVPPPPAPHQNNPNILSTSGGVQLLSTPQIEHNPPPVHVNIPPPGIHIPQHVGPLVPPPVPAATPYVLQEGLVYQAPPQHMIIATQLQVEQSPTQQPDPREQQQKFHIIGHVNNQGQQFNTNIIATSNPNPNSLMIQAPYQMSAPGIQQVNISQMRIQGDQHHQVQVQGQAIHPNQVQMQVQTIHPNQLQMQPQIIHPNQVQAPVQALQPNQVQVQAMHPNQMQVQAQPMHPSHVQMQAQPIHPSHVQMQAQAIHPNQEFIVNQNQHNPNPCEPSGYQMREESNKEQPEIATRYWQYSAVTQRSGEEDNNNPHQQYGVPSSYRTNTDGEPPSSQTNTFILQRNDKQSKFTMATATNRSPEQQNRKRRFEEGAWDDARNKRFDSSQDEPKTAAPGMSAASDNKRQRDGGVGGRSKGDTEGGNPSTWSNQKGEVMWRNSEHCDSNPSFQTRAPPSTLGEGDNNESSYSMQKNFWPEMKNGEVYKNVPVPHYAGNVVQQSQHQGDERTQGQQVGQGKVPYYLLPPSPPPSTQMVVVQGYNNNQHAPIYSQPGVQLNNVSQQPNNNMMQAPPPTIQPGGIVLTSVPTGVPPNNSNMHPGNMMQPAPASYNMYAQPLNQSVQHHAPYVPNSGQSIVACTVPPPNILCSRPQQLTVPPPAVGHAPQPQHNYTVWTNNSNVQ